MDLEEMNRNVIAEFRSSGGKVGGNFDGTPLLLLNTVGAKSGEPRTKPLAYLMDGERYIIIASFAGSPTHPPWYFNLLANPDVEVEVGNDTFKARATILDEPERTNLYDKMVSAIPVFGEYRDKTSRTIPVIALDKI